jgi:hypothetical protein
MFARGEIFGTTLGFALSQASREGKIVFQVTTSPFSRAVSLPHEVTCG